MWNPFKKKKPVDPLIDALYHRHVCPDCGGGAFNMGPKGGISQNIKCSTCNSEFNVAPFEDGKWFGPPFPIERINRSEAERISIYGS